MNTYHKWRFIQSFKIHLQYYFNKKPMFYAEVNYWSTLTSFRENRIINERKTFFCKKWLTIIFPILFLGSITFFFLLSLSNAFSISYLSPLCLRSFCLKETSNTLHYKSRLDAEYPKSCVFIFFFINPMLISCGALDHTLPFLLTYVFLL